ncbi:hypothetical protein JZ751_014451 [Albula glossodonta]|uniref:Uncharacterized protein n=1 Tax=Albula glossodonta TaxID=121402 RepID=A0A8T2N0A4_9TELE|nr:hypothetical protein JZ751_014451 [Albula glossodonta]
MIQTETNTGSRAVSLIASCRSWTPTGAIQLKYFAHGYYATDLGAEPATSEPLISNPISASSALSAAQLLCPGDERQENEGGVEEHCLRCPQSTAPYSNWALQRHTEEAEREREGWGSGGKRGMRNGTGEQGGEREEQREFRCRGWRGRLCLTDRLAGEGVSFHIPEHNTLLKERERGREREREREIKGESGGREERKNESESMKEREGEER